MRVSEVPGCTVLNNALPQHQFMSPWNLRVGPPAEIGALRTELVETRSYWVRVGTESDDLCPYKTKDRDNREEAGVAKMQLQAKGYQKLERSKEASSLVPSEQTWLCQYLDFGLLACRTLRESISVILTHPVGVVCYSSPRTECTEELLMMLLKTSDDS